MTRAPNPLDIFARKQKVGPDDADAIRLPLMIHLDAAKRGQCTGPGANFLTRHLIIASYIAQRTRSKRFHDQIVRAYSALKKASDRPTQLLDLTTGEHRALAEAFKTYLCALPEVEVGTMHDANLIALEKMK